MDAILNYQNPVIGDPDLMVIDGEKQKFSKTNDQINAFNKLNNSRIERLEIPFFLNRNSTTEQFSLYKVQNNGIILCSILEDKDMRDRFIGYTYYYSNGNDFCQAKMTLENYAIIAGVHPNKKDLEMFEKMMKLYSKYPILINNSSKLAIAFAILCVIAIIYIFFDFTKINNKTLLID